MAAELEAVNRGDESRVLINIPRRHTKSDTVSVCWPAWTWLQHDRGWPLGGPWVRFIFASHSHELAMELSRKCRMLVESEWYQDLAEGQVMLSAEANALNSWQLTAGGARRAFSIETRQTGFGADVMVIDDPHDIREVESAAHRETVRVFAQEVVPGSINDPSRHGRVVVAQRTHARDLSALILEGDEPYRHLCLPGLYDPHHPHLSDVDWRRTEGQPLWPERFGPAAYDALAGTAYARAAQVQQDPRKRGGTIFSAARWEIVDDWPRHGRLVRFWDKAATAEGDAADPDYTAGVLMTQRDGVFYVLDVVRGRWSPRDVRQRMRITAESDGAEVGIYVEEEGGSSGKDVTDELQRSVLRGFSVRGRRATGPKLVRIDPYLAACEAGNVRLVRGSWNAAFLAEHDEWTGGDAEHDDQIIAAAGAHREVVAALSVPGLVW